MTPEQQATLKAYILADPAMPAEAAVGRDVIVTRAELTP